MGGKVAPPQLNTATLPFLEEISCDSLIGMIVEMGERLLAQGINFNNEKREEVASSLSGRLPASSTAHLIILFHCFISTTFIPNDGGGIFIFWSVI